MISLTGTLVNVLSAPYTDRTTGEVSTVHTAEILHAVNGKSEISTLKLDESVLSVWTEATGKDIRCEVRFYAMASANAKNGVNTGLSLVDKKSFPLLSSVLQPLKKAA
jgi:hypothetical protein